MAHYTQKIVSTQRKCLKNCTKKVEQNVFFYKHNNNIIHEGAAAAATTERLARLLAMSFLCAYN